MSHEHPWYTLFRKKFTSISVYNNKVRQKFLKYTHRNLQKETFHSWTNILQKLISKSGPLTAFHQIYIIPLTALDRGTCIIIHILAGYSKWADNVRQPYCSMITLDSQTRVTILEDPTTSISTPLNKKLLNDPTAYCNIRTLTSTTLHYHTTALQHWPGRAKKKKKPTV